MFASNVKRDLRFIDQISDLKELTKIDKKIDKPNLVISPTVCYHIFETFKDSNINVNKVFDSISSCNRFESINYLTFERLQSFTMREFVAFGSPVFVKNFLIENINYYKKKFIKNKIKFKIVTANDQFFTQQGIKKMAYQSLNDLKFEFQFWLPYEEKWLSVGSFNNHLDILVKKYNIKCKKKIVYSGCIGWGYERFIYAIIAQGKNLNY
jgi:seryl-tRNA synthetase